MAVAPFYVFNIAYLTEARKCTDTLINVKQITADSGNKKEEERWMIFIPDLPEN